MRRGRSSLPWCGSEPMPRIARSSFAFRTGVFRCDRMGARMLPLAHVDHVALEKVVEERSDDGNGGEPSDFVPRRRDRRTDDVRSELERETRDEPPREPDPDRAALVATRGAALENHARRRDERFDCTERDDDERHQVDDELDDMRHPYERLVHARSLGQRRTADHAPKAEMAGRRVDLLRHSCGGAITAAVVGCAQVRAALHHLSRYADFRRTWVVALFRIAAAARIVDRAAGFPDLAVVLVPVGRPFPHVPGHLMKAVAVRWKRSDGCGPLVAVLDE